MTKRTKPLPKFASETAERRFWETHDSTPYVDWSQAERAVFTQQKPTTRSITLRLPETLLAGLKTAANQRDVPYQSLIKVWLAEKLEESEAR
jgi:predicted DNA binding CopG/RHH family protein